MYYRQQNGAISVQPQPYLMEVTGEGEIAVPPNLATVNLGVMTEGKEVLAAQQENSKNINKVINSILSLGIPKNQIKTFDYRIDSVFDFDQGKQIFKGYKVTHLLEVIIEDLSMVGNVVDTSVQQGANYVANVHFKVKNEEVVYQQALTLAINDASKKARTIAETIKVQLYPIPILVIEGAGVARPFFNEQVTYVKGVSSTQFEPGQITVKASIRAKFHYSPL